VATVIIGQPHTGNTRLYPAFSHSSTPRLTDRTVFTGFVSEEEKAALYAGAGLGSSRRSTRVSA
jgi:hypothetical protein